MMVSLFRFLLNLEKRMNVQKLRPILDATLDVVPFRTEAFHLQNALSFRP